jgi:hypothetical protein
MTDIEKYTVESLGRIQLYLGLTMLHQMDGSKDDRRSFGLKMIDFLQGWIDSQDILGNSPPEEMRNYLEQLIGEYSDPTPSE